MRYLVFTVLLCSYEAVPIRRVWSAIVRANQTLLLSLFSMEFQYTLSFFWCCNLQLLFDC